jgi:hypothetical protein
MATKSFEQQLKRGMKAAESYLQLQRDSCGVIVVKVQLKFESPNVTKTM